MSGVVNWIKSNLLIVICVSVSVMSLVSLLVWPTASSGENLVETIKKKSGPMPKRLKGYLSSPIEIPPAELDDTPLTISWPISQAIIDRLQKIFKEREAEYQRFAEMIINRNNPYVDDKAQTQRKHTTYAPGVLPRVTTDDRLFTAKTQYLKAVDELLASLNAATPPDQQAIEKLLKKTDIDWRAENNVPQGQELGVALQNQLNRELARAQMRLYRENAAGHGVYANKGLIKKMGWAQEEGLKASPLQVFKGQLQLWILRDVIDAILLANTPEGAKEPNLLTGPVKNLEVLAVEKTFLGIAQDDLGRGADLYKQDVLPNRFDLNPTGRISNNLYDVHTAYVKAVVDLNQLPKLINSFRQINFMTVTSVQTVPADPFRDFAKGYYYGVNQHIAVVHLKIETIWFRKWVAGHESKQAAEEAKETFNPGYMPDSVRHYLGLPTRDPEFKQNAEGFSLDIENE